MRTVKRRIDSIWDAQKIVLERIDPIERANGQRMAGVYPVDLNTREGQARIRYWVNCYCEELAEAYDAFRSGPNHRDKLLEELVDCYKFLINLSLQAGIDYPNEWHSTEDLYDIFRRCPPLNYGTRRGSAEIQFMFCFGKVHYLCTLLRNQPWRQTEKPLNHDLFKRYLMTSFEVFHGLINLMGFSDSDFFHCFNEKTRVNIDRVEEGR